ncbi:MAG: hypothetical protein AB202_00060 [Parcubacteria bacterium C7867-007]|nr:MAG: hypothetical protein AB202_00060 [Parcubacteria bacterium C7867-007]
MDAFHTFLDNVQREILTPIVAVIALAAFILFIYGMVKFIYNAGDAAKRAEGQKQMLYGIIGLAIMFGANALVNLLQGTVSSLF